MSALPTPRWRAAALGAVAVALALFALTRFATFARNKPFWLDEGYEIVRTCGEPRAHMLIAGVRECSPAPLYWLAQSFVVRNVEPSGPSLRVKYRAVSLAAAALTLVLLALGLGTRLGLATAAVAVATLLADPVFFHYAAENRAYMTWILVTTVLLLATAETVRRAEPQRTPWPLLAACLLAGLTTLPGTFQAAAAAVVAWLALGCCGPRARPSRRLAFVLLAGVLVVAALDAHYWAGGPCRNVATGYLGVASSPERWTLARRALALFWPEATSGWTWCGYALTLLGACVPLACWRRRASLDATERFAVGLSLAAVAETLVALPVAAGLVAGQYFFLPRMFIFLLPTRAVLVGLGFWLAVRLVTARATPALRPVLSLLGPVVAALFATWALLAADEIAGGTLAPPPSAAGVSCEALRAGELHVLRRSEDERYEHTPNFLVRLGAALEACPGGGAGGTRYVLSGDPSGPDWLRITDAPPTDAVPMRVCGTPVVLRPR